MVSPGRVWGVGRLSLAVPRAGIRGKSGPKGAYVTARARTRRRERAGCCVQASWQYKGGWRYYLTEDHLGGTALVTNANGAMVGRVRYYPYGGVRIQEGTIPPAKLFTGQAQGTATGISHHNPR